MVPAGHAEPGALERLPGDGHQAAVRGVVEAQALLADVEHEHHVAGQPPVADVEGRGAGRVAERGPPGTADAVADAAALTVIHFVLYVLAGIAIGVSVGVNLYVVIALEDLQSDLVNPHDATRRINRLVVWDVGSHAIGTVFMLLSGHWIVAAMNAPLIYYHAEG